MDNSQRTQLAPPAAEPEAISAAPAQLAATADADADATDWYWCPVCKLASSRLGDCPGCGRGYEPIPAAGVPDAEYRPRVASGPSRFATVGSVAGVLGLLAAAAASIALLAVSGDSTTTSGAASASAMSMPLGGASSSFSVGALHGALRLQGAWSTSTDKLVLTQQQTGGAPFDQVLAVGKGSEQILIASFAVADPAGALQAVLSKPGTAPWETAGDTITDEVSRGASIAGYVAVAQDYEIHDAGGALVSRGTVFAVNAGDHVVVIRTAAGPADAKDLAGIEQALVDIG